jgi:hypothetical protein
MLMHEFLSIYPAKLAEYCLALTYLLAFIGWWRFVNGGERAAVEAPAEETAARTAVTQAAPPAQWFTRGLIGVVAAGQCGRERRAQ